LTAIALTGLENRDLGIRIGAKKARNFVPEIAAHYEDGGDILLGSADEIRQIELNHILHILIGGILS